ncbi:hypothetical protein VTJ04DRAFT_7926 [Mycothermus thermophilus]|uniref:uncharacterized protein n=1 Tax=Humicola insolens TaxID=85995 RepID=UPI003743FD38
MAKKNHQAQLPHPERSTFRDDGGGDSDGGPARQPLLQRQSYMDHCVPQSHLFSLLGPWPSLCRRRLHRLRQQRTYTVDVLNQQAQAAHAVKAPNANPNAPTSN